MCGWVPQVHKSALDAVAAIVRDCMQHCVYLSVPIEVNLSVGPAWGSMDVFQAP
jgi:DNA polymerase I-like protein with 3'-5' exonuclease and polymerase domains